jgi:hypothetical protein
MYEADDQELFGATSRAGLQHGVELGFGDSDLVRYQSTWSTGDWWASYSPDVMGQCGG